MRDPSALALACIAVLLTGGVASAGEWKLRESITDKNKVSEPASAFMVKPEDGDRAWGMDAAVLYDFEAHSKAYSLFMYSSYDRNTSIDDEQDLFTAGFGWELQADLDKKNRNWGPVYTATVDYKDNGSQDAKGFRATGGVTIDSNLKPSKGSKSLWYPGSPGPRKAGDYFGWQWECATYLQYDRTTTAGSGEPEGGIARSFSDVAAYAYPGGLKVHNQIEIVAAYRYTWDFSRSSELDVGTATARHFKASANFYLANNQKFGLGLDYSHGADPAQELADQSFYKVTFKAQI